VLVWEKDGETTANYILKFVKDAPTLDVEPVRHGRWIKSKTEKLYFGHGMEGYYDYPELCSRCHYDATEYGRGVGNYCPNCGAKMEFGGI
jgi:hypothetical protein